MPNYQLKKLRFEYLGIVLAFLSAYLELFDVLEKFFIEKQIVLEFDQSDSTPFTYVVTGAVADENYLLETIKLSASPDNIKQVTFQYDHYPEIKLEPNTITTPDTYKVSRDFLEKNYNEDNFHFEFLDNNRFTFKFQLSGNEQPKFECKVFTVQNTSIPCEIKEKSGFFSLIRDIPWYGIWGILFVVLVISFHFFDFLGGRWKRQSPDDSRNVYKTVKRR
ncbi:hypothetical protein PN36_09610 [Candidatus Thiomargarita nelsonii]|uniref:Uncharacterized protein n=1 Tax=Candidatus Thiomargarita nelsonii TaxID=1003181 RepID=A0A4E0R3N9_9GAMM|nr:hypothetical protein PN36_09610 [Candidatus Thiomargarita nelsonii]